MDIKAKAADFVAELKAEAVSTRKCLERIPEDKYDYKPHPTSMGFGELALLVAEIPLWIKTMVEDKYIDLATFEHLKTKTTKALVEHFDKGLEGAIRAIENAGEEDLKASFILKAGGKVVMEVPNVEYIGPTINHWVHHRGQLTVYMRLCEIKVPSIYGPSADERE